MSQSLPYDNNGQQASNGSTRSLEKTSVQAETSGSSTGDGYYQSRGVTRMEAVYRVANSSGGRTTFWAIAISVLVCAWAYSLDSSTTSNYAPLVTSQFKQHSSGLASLNIATNIISAVCKPFLAKISDITSRPYTYILVLVLYVMGYIIVATCHTISAYIVGEVFVAIGSSGLDLLNDLIVADLTTLEWRGFVSSMLSMPFVVNTWFAGLIVDALRGNNQWRWGYGMFAIIMPAALGPAIITLIHLDRKANKLGIVNMASGNAARREARELAEKKGEEGPHGLVVTEAAPSQLTWSQRLKQSLSEIDAFGLILLGFGWSLLLLPFSLKTYAKGGWDNPSLIAMMVVGGVILILYIFYERFVARFPTSPRRLLTNKTFLCAVVIDSFYFIAGQMRGLYLSSYVYVITDWRERDWVYFNNTMTLCLCIFGVIAGLILRWTHRYKLLQVIGLSIKIVGIGILLDGKSATQSTAAMAMSQVLIGAGGAMSVVSSRVASQASVPHQDLALTISLLSLWSKIGSSIGSALAAVIWADKMPKFLREEVPSSVTNAQIRTFFGDIKKIRAYASPRSSKDEKLEVMPIAAAEFERMKKEIEELRGMVQDQKKTIKKNIKKIDELNKEVTSAKLLKKEQENQIQALSSKVAKNDEIIKSIESNLNCQICMDIMNKPFALSPCGHVLCMSCLQDWFRKAPPTLDDMDIDPEDADDPEYLKYRQKSCPCCRAIILKRPAPVFVLKSVVNAVIRHKFDSHSPTTSSQRSNSPLVGEEDPWEGLFPDEHEDDMIDEDDGYLRHYYGNDLYLDSDSEGLESIMIEVDSDAESAEDDGEEHHHEPGELSDAESLEDPLYIRPSWEPPIGTHTREELIHLPAQKAAMLIRGATLWMIRALHMDYSHGEGFIVYLHGLDDVGQVPYDTMYRRSAEERQKRNLHRIFLGWNIRGAREGLNEEGGKEFMNQLLDSYTNEPWKFYTERHRGKLDVHVLVRADECVDYDTTDTEQYY